jgi:hypothetical protein
MLSWMLNTTALMMLRTETSTALMLKTTKIAEQQI